MFVVRLYLLHTLLLHSNALFCHKCMSYLSLIWHNSCLGAVTKRWHEMFESVWNVIIYHSRISSPPHFLVACTDSTLSYTPCLCLCPLPSPIHFILKMEAPWSSRMLVFCHTTIWCCNPEDCDFSLHHHKNLKSHITVHIIVCKNCQCTFLFVQWTASLYIFALLNLSLYST